MSKLEKFFADGFADQLNMMGQDCYIESKIKQSKTRPFKAVVTHKSGETEVEIGGLTYVVSAHALIPATRLLVKDLISNRLCTGDAEYLIISAVKDISQNFYSCDLVKL